MKPPTVACCNYKKSDKDEKAKNNHGEVLINLSIFAYIIYQGRVIRAGEDYVIFASNSTRDR